MDGTNRIRRIIIFVFLAVVAGAAIFVLRGPHISNALKKAILPELENLSGRKVIAQKIYVNIFPLFIEARGIKAFEENGSRIASAQRVKAYVDLSGLFSRTIVIRRLVIREPEVTANRGQVEDVVRHAEAYLDTVRETAFKVKVRAVEIQKGDIDFSDPAFNIAARLKGLSAEAVLGDSQRVNAVAEAVNVRKEGLPEISADAAVTVQARKDSILVKRIVIGSLGSKLSGSGEYQRGKGSFMTDLTVLFSSVKKLFGLSRPGEGKVQASGDVRLAGKAVNIDLKVDGSFYLQTLMELLKVTEPLEGMVDVAGRVKGPLTDLRAAGTARLRKGSIFEVSVDSLSCKVLYEKGAMSFSDGTARLYNGSARVNASIALPVVNYFTVNVDYSGVDSPPLFKLIGWDPGIAPGKVSGTLATAGADFNPSGWFEYRNPVSGRDVLGRIREMKGKYAVQGASLNISELGIDTGLTKINAGGVAELKNKTLQFSGELRSQDITDLSAPYYNKLKGEGEFRGTVTGSFDDPVLSGHIAVQRPAFEHYAADAIAADVVYRRNLLTVRDMLVTGPVELSRVTGTVSFKNAKTLFDLSSPGFDLSASLKDADLDRFARVFYPEFRGKGRLHADMRIRGVGDRPIIKGTGSADHAELYGIPLDSASFGWSYQDETLSFRGIRITRGKSALAGDFSVNTDGVFSYTASTDRMLLSDVAQRSLKGDAVFSLSSEGHGTFDNPELSLSGRIIEGRLRGKPVGSGSLTATIKERDITLLALLFNDKVRVTARGRLEKDIPWDARVDIQTARYDAVLGAFLKDIPEDLILSMNGTIALRGDRSHVNASSVIKQMALSMYGYSFTNDREIRLELKDRLLSMNRITLKSGSTSLNMDGSLQIGKSYNIAVEGSSSLAPFKSLSARIGLLRGDAEFVLAVTGDWDGPQINGGVTLTNGAFGLRDYAYRISSLSGYLYMDNDRIVLQKLTGKVGGGDVDISGIVYLKKFAFKRFYVEAALQNITATPSHDFTVNFGGNLLYKGTPESQLIAGELRVNRARYRERVEWKSWLLQTKKTEKFKPEITNMDKAELNIKVSGKDSILLDNNVGRATVSADMILRGTVYRPALFGRIDSNDGTVFFRNNEFRILHASAGFFDPNRINPIIQIAAETVVKGYKIKMNLEGQTDHFAVSFSSDPLLKETDILSLLAVGQTTGELKGLEGGIGAGEATSFVTGKLQDVVEERMRTITGLDRFQIDSYVSKKTGAVEPRVTVSKRLLSDRFFVTYASSVGSTEEQIIKLEYFLSRNFSLVGMRDERGIVGGDIRFRFEFR